MTKTFSPALLTLCLGLMPMLAPAPVLAQAQVALGGLTVDQSAPVEVTAASLSVDQASRRAIYEGNVVIGQGTMRIAAGRVEIIFSESSGDISRLLASGGVTFVTDTEQAESREADYDLTSGQVVLVGDVLLTQGTGAISADRMVINVADGTARMEGQVRTIFGQQN